MNSFLFLSVVVQIFIPRSQAKPQVAVVLNGDSGDDSCKDSNPSCSTWQYQCDSTTDARYRDEWCRKTCGTCEPSVRDVNKTECPSPWFLIGDQCFLLVREESDWLPWTSARAQCGNLAQGADLAQPTDIDVLVGLYQYIRNKGNDYWSGVDFWLGGSDINAEGEWRWLNGDKIPVGADSGWIRGEPNDKHPGEDCLELAPFYSPGTKSMNDNGCDKSHAFICERY